MFALTPPDGMPRTSGPCNRLIGDSDGRVENDELVSVDWDTTDELEHGHKSENEHCGDGDGIEHDKKNMFRARERSCFGELEEYPKREEE